MIVDSHCHIYDEKLKDLRDNILENLKTTPQICVCSSDTVENSQKSIDLANSNKNVYATIGIHPHEAKSFGEKTLKIFEKMLKDNSKVVAIGEIGLDYYYDYDFKDLQIEVLKKQIAFANMQKKPCVFHVREAMGDFLNVVEEMKDCFKIPGIMHSFNGSVEVAKILIKKGFYLSFNGIITFKNANKLLDVVKQTPIDNILIETDSPYLTPVPFRGQVNRPEYVKYVAQKIAELKDMSIDEVITCTTRNAFRAYRIEV